MNLPPDQTIQIAILSCPAHLPVVRSAVEKTCRLVGFDEEAAGNIVLSVDEALTNIIRHAYGGADDQPIEIRLTPFRGEGREGLQICLRDYGCAVDPSRIRPRDLSDVRPGGLGVYILQSCMDRVEYQPADGGGTLLTMVKQVPPAPRKKGQQP